MKRLTLLFALIAFTLTANAQSVTYSNSLSGQSVNGVDIALADIAPNEPVSVQPFFGYATEGNYDYFSTGIMSTGYLSSMFFSPEVRFMKRGDFRGVDESGKLFIGFGISAGIHIKETLHIGSSFKVLNGYRQINPVMVRLSL